jgi:hypothetical protein
MPDNLVDNSPLYGPVIKRTERALDEVDAYKADLLEAANAQPAWTHVLRTNEGADVGLVSRTIKEAAVDLGISMDPADVMDTQTWDRAQELADEVSRRLPGYKITLLPPMGLNQALGGGKRG